MCCAVRCEWTRYDPKGPLRETLVVVSPSITSFRRLRERVSRPDEKGRFWVPGDLLTEIVPTADTERQARMGVYSLLNRTRA